MAVLGLRFCARALSSCGKRGPLFIAVRGPLTIAASLVAEHRLQTRGLSGGAEPGITGDCGGETDAGKALGHHGQCQSPPPPCPGRTVQQPP